MSCKNRVRDSVNIKTHEREMRHMFTQAFEEENGEITEKLVCEEVIPQNFPTITKH